MTFGRNEFAYTMMIAAGAYVVVSCVADWDHFFSSPRSLSETLGRTGARIFWGGFGLLLIAFGIACLLGLMPMPLPKTS